MASALVEKNFRRDGLKVCTNLGLIKRQLECVRIAVSWGPQYMRVFALFALSVSAIAMSPRSFGIGACRTSALSVSCALWGLEHSRGLHYYQANG